MTTILPVCSGVAELEKAFGDPWGAGNPVGNAAILAADERAEMFAAGEELLDDYGLGAEFVPPQLGGRFDRLDRMIGVMRAVFRRDPCLGLGYGASSFISSVNVWSAGNAGQQADLAAVLLNKGRVASVYHELAHGNDFAHAEFNAFPTGSGTLRLNGRKEVITNVQRAQGLILFARTAEAAGARSHSQLFIDKRILDAARMRYLPRFPSAGMRGVQLGGIEFDDCPVPESTVLGGPGKGMETALRSFQLTRTALPAMIVGSLDTGLRATLRVARSRRLYGGTAIDLASPRQILAEAFLDLLICDCLATVTARTVHLLPAQTSIYASATKYFLGGRLRQAMYRLSQVLGAQFYMRDGEFGIFQKHLRDMAPASFGHAARIACLATLLPQLPLVARRSWPSAQAAPDAVFDLAAPLPPLEFSDLAVTSSGREDLTTALEPRAGDPEPIRRLAAEFNSELAQVKDACRSLPPRDLTPSGRPEAFAVADRYTVVLAATACLNIWRHNRSNGFLGDPAWITAALQRLGGGSPRLEPLFAELDARFASGRTFDLSGCEVGH